MSRELKAFQEAILVRNIVARFVEAKEFSSPEALKKYLQAHPKADKSKHKVRDDGDETKEEQAAKKKRQTGEVTDKGETDEEYANRLKRKKKEEKSKEQEKAKAYLKPGHDETEEEYAARKKLKKK